MVLLAWSGDLHSEGAGQRSCIEQPRAQGLKEGGSEVTACCHLHCTKASTEASAASLLQVLLHTAGIAHLVLALYKQ